MLNVNFIFFHWLKNNITRKFTRTHMALIMFLLSKAALETQTKEAQGVSLSNSSQEAGWARKTLCGCFDGRVLYGVRRQQGEAWVTSLYRSIVLQIALCPSGREIYGWSKWLVSRSSAQMTSLLLWFQAGNVVDFAEFTFALFFHAVIFYEEKEGREERRGGRREG